MATMERNGQISEEALQRPDPSITDNGSTGETDLLFKGYDTNNRVIKYMRAFYDIQLREGMEGFEFTLPGMDVLHQEHNSFSCPGWVTMQC